MNILALDTKNKQAQLALKTADEVVFETTLENESHSESLLPKIDAILTQNNLKIADINVFSVAIGPGSFTGIRIGVSMVKAFLFRLEKKCVAVNTFEMLSYNINSGNAPFLLALNADNRGCYVGEFDESKHLVRTMLYSLDELEKECASKNLALFVKSEEVDYFNHLNVKLNLVLQTKEAQLNVTLEKIKNNEFINSSELEPLYIKLSQAEDQFREKLLNHLLIKKADKTHLLSLEKLEKEIFLEEAYSLNSLKDELNSEDRVILIATLNEEIIGYVIVLKTLDNMLNILKIAVKPMYRKLQVATKLFEKVLELKQNEGFEKIFLEVNEHNKSAINFYKKMGLKETYKRQKYYKDGSDAIIMFL